VIDVGTAQKALSATNDDLQSQKLNVHQLTLPFNVWACRIQGRFRDRQSSR